MKKQLIATVCAFTLAFTIPAAAFAEDVDTDATGSEPEVIVPLADDEGDAVEPPVSSNTIEGTVDGDTTTFDVPENTFTDAVWEDNEWVVKNVLEQIVVEGAENVTVSTTPDYSKYDADALQEYRDKLNQVYADKGDWLFSVEINGDVLDGQDHAVVTFQLNKDVYGNKVINYYILHEDGSIQEKVVRVHADGTVRIWMESFSIVTFMDVDGIEKYENMVEPQDGDELSPQTGC